MPANHEELIIAFSENGLNTFIQSTRTLVVLITEGGRLITWNPAFDTLKQELPQARHLRDFLALSSRTIFDLLLSNVTHDRLATQGELDLGQGNRLSGYSCRLHPVSNGRVLFIAEPSHAVTDLETVSEELQRAKQSLERKETELHAVLSQAHEVATMDSLTSLPSRREVMAELQEMVAFSDKYGTLLSILLIDVDNFKIINDTHGHLIGDEVLRALAAKLQQFVTPPDAIGRVGGEEFLIILPHTTATAAAEFAGWICEQVRVLLIHAGEQAFAITVSIGVVQHKVSREDWQEFLQRVDTALLSAKNNGRDQWRISE